MKFKRLHLDGFGIFETEVTVNFNEKGISVILGDNESGKSTLMYGLISTIYGLSSRRKSEVIPWSGKSSGTGVLEAENNGDLKIEREFETHQTRLLLSPSNGNPVEKYSGEANPEGRKESKRYFEKISDLFGVPTSSMLESISFIRQSEMMAEIDTKLREIITGSGTGDYKRAEEKLKQETDNVTSRAFWTKRKKKDRDLEDLEDQIRQLKENLEEALRALREGGDIEGEVDSTAIEIKGLEDKLLKERSLLSAVEKYSENLSELKKAKQNEGEIQEKINTRKSQEEDKKKHEEKIVKAGLGDSTDRDEVLDELSELIRLNTEIEGLKDELESFESEFVEKKSSTGWIRIRISLVAGALGVSLGIIGNSIILSIFAGFALLALVYFLTGFFLRHRSEDKGRSAKIEIRKGDLEKKTEHKAELEGIYSNLLTDRHINDLVDAIKDVKELKKKVEIIEGMTMNTESLEELRGEQDKIQKEIRQRKYELDSLEKEYPVLKGKEQNIDKIYEIEQEVKERIKGLVDLIEKAEGKKNELERDLARREGRGILNIDILEEMIKDKKSEYENCFQKAEGLQLAVKTLSDSIDRFQTTYHEKLAEKITELFRRFAGERYSRVILTDSWEPRIITDEGKEVSADVLSVGARDQLYFAVRIAIASTIVHRVKLPIVLDDPFVNFDSSRLAHAKEMVTELSKEHQIILFTHDRSYSDWGEVVLNLDEYWRAR